MNIGGINTTYSTHRTNAAHSKSADNSAGSPATPAATAHATSTIVTLSNGANSSVKEGSVTGLSATPLAAAWAPQMLVQGDLNKDAQLDTKEFAVQLKRVGIDTQEAQKLFDSFDTSSDGLLSIDEFAKGVKASIDSGVGVFTTLANSYTHDAAGNFDAAALGDFLAKGQALADKYAHQIAAARRG